MLLSGPWNVSDGDHSFTCDAPFDVVSSLHDAGLIPDPYWGRNEYDLRWICERDWQAKTTFDLETTACDLVLSGLDGIVEVLVNGQVMLKADNAFRTWRIDLSQAGRVGSNDLQLRFLSVVREGAAIAARQPFPVPQTKNCPIPYGNLIRKQHCDWGWDWNIALAPVGLTGEVRVVSHAVEQSGHLAIHQRMVGVKIEVDLTWGLQGLDGQTAQFTLAGITATASIRDGMAKATLSIKTPELWWPNGQGAQPLFDLTAKAGPLTETRRIGLRVIELISEPDEAGRSFGFRVNGRDVFAKGANWIPADALAGRIDRAAVRDLLQSAVDAHMNMIRIWGGGRYEPDWFYDLCDELGLMVWQDFMFACSLYPCDADFLANVREEAIENVQRLQHHASLALWCGDNELIGALLWYDESRKDRDRYLVAYDRLNRTLEQALFDADPQANWWPSSPSPGPLSFGDAWHDDSAGDMHFWSVWHEGRDFDHYRDVSPRFCSEFGFQSYPSMSAIRAIAEPKDFNIAAPVFESHQKNTGGNARIAETMFRYFRFPVDFENFVYLSQVQQALAIKTAVTHWRSLKPHCQGALIWQLNDTWPCASWSSLDHGGNWKLLHHMARDFFQPVLVTVVPDGDDLIVFGVNDLPDEVDLSVRLMRVALDGEIAPISTSTARVGSDALELTRIKADILGPQEMLALVWEGSDGTRSGDIFAPRPWKAYDLQAPKITHTVARTDTGYEITLTAQAPALFVALEADVPGLFSDNAFTLFPGFDAKITFSPQNADIEPSFIIRNLHSATYGGPA